MNVTKLSSPLTIKSVLGVNDQANTYFLLDETIIFYVAGHNVIKRHLLNNTQQFISGGNVTKKITAIASTENKNFLVIAENGSETVLNIYDTTYLEKKNTINITLNECMELECVLVQFFNNDNLLCGVLKGTTDTYIMIWDPTNGALVTYKKFSFKKFSSLVFSTLDTRKFFVVFEDAIFILTAEGKEIKETDILDQKYLSSNKNSAFHNAQYLRYIDSFLFARDFQGICSIRADGQETHFYEISASFKFFLAREEKIFFMSDNYCIRKGELDPTFYIDCIEIYNSDELGRISSFWSSSRSEQCLVMMAHRQIFRLNFQPIDGNFFQPMTESGHGGPIISVDICRRKNLLVTASADRRVILWDYNTMRYITCFSIGDEPVSLSLHPSGFYLLIAFSERIVTEKISADNYLSKREQFREIFLSGIQEARFTRGGDKLAIAAGNPPVIYLYRFFSFERFGPLLRGHLARITCLRFSLTENLLFSSSSDGVIFRWNLLTGQRTEMSIRKGPIFSFGLQPIFDTGSPIITSLYNDANKDKTSQVPADRTINSEPNYLSLEATSCGQYLFGAIEGSGCVWYSRNWTNATQPLSIAAHGAEGALKIAISQDDAVIASGGSDGIICFFELHSYHKLTKRCDEIIISHTTLDELRMRKENIVTANTDSMLNTNQILQISQRDALNALRDRAHNLNANSVEEEHTNFERRKAYSQHCEEELRTLRLRLDDELGEQQHILAQRLSSTANILEDLRFQLKKLERENEFNILQKGGELQAENDQLKTVLSEKLAARQQQLAQVYIDKNIEEGRTNEYLETLRREIGLEKSALQDRYRSVVTKMLEEVSKAKNQVFSIKKKRDILIGQIEQLRQSLQEGHKNLTVLAQRRETLTIAASTKKELLREKSATVAEKEKKIYELKKATQELEKFKFVLDHSIKELNEEVGPKEREIRIFRVQIAEQDEKLKEFFSLSLNIAEALHALEAREDDLKSVIYKHEEELKDMRRDLENIKTTISECVKMDDLQTILKKIKARLRNPRASDLILAQHEQAYKNQVEYIRSSIEVVKEEILKDNDLHQLDGAAFVQKNRELIEQINEIRKEVRNIKYPEKADILIGRKNKKLRKWLTEGEIQLTYEEKVAYLANLEKQLAAL